ncbi:type II toxin-antitoxin system Phd/YefM family antitoxin [Fusobacterium animalis]
MEVLKMIAINVNDIFDKMIGNEDEVIIKRDNHADDLVLLTAKKYNAILEELKRFQYWNEIDKRMEDLHAGKGQIHELIEVDDD